MSECMNESVYVREYAHYNWGTKYDFTEELDDYCDWLRSIGRKVRTIVTYHSDIKTALEGLYKAGLPWKCREIGPREIYYLKDNMSVKEQTAHVRIKRLDAMIQWKVGRSVVQEMSILWNRVIRERHFISKEQFGAMYRIATPPERMVLLLGGMMGLRRAEITAIKLDDIGPFTITIHGKGHGDQGLVSTETMPMEVIEELKVYKRWRSKNVRDPYDRRLIIMTLPNGAVCRQKFQGTRISEAMTDLAQRVGVTASTHALRRLFGTTAYAVSGHDLAVTQKMLRHASPNTTIMCYIDADETTKTETLSGVGALLASAL